MFASSKFLQNISMIAKMIKWHDCRKEFLETLVNFCHETFSTKVNSKLTPVQQIAKGSDFIFPKPTVP